MLLRLNYHRFLLRLCCYVLPLFAIETAAAIRFSLGGTAFLPPFLPQRSGYAVISFTATLLWVIAAEQFGVCSVEELYRERTGIRRASSACIATYIALVSILFFVRTSQFSRLVIALGAVFLLLGTLLVHAAFRALVRGARRARRPIRILVVGADSFARRAVARLRRAPIVPSLVVGYVRLPDQEVAVNDAPVYSLQHVHTLMNMNLDDVIIAVPLDRLSSITGLAEKLDALCVPIRAVIDLSGNSRIRERLFQFGRMQLLDLSLTPAESLDYTVFKRAFDIVFSAMVLLLLSPLLAIIAVAVKLSSKGPIFFKQERVGLNGQLFMMYKFRTMRVSNSGESDTAWTTAEDPRRTWIGTFLRKSSLDELPQFLNVLKGDMSVVGPRPERPYYVKKFLMDIARYNNRHRLKVGITGWAQVNGWRGDTSIQKRLECDLYYLRNWNFWFDLRIVLLTLWSGLLGKNAY